MKSASQLQTLPFRASNHIKLKPLKTKQQRTALEMQAVELLKLVQSVKEQERLISELSNPEAVDASHLDVSKLYYESNPRGLRNHRTQRT